MFYSPFSNKYLETETIINFHIWRVYQPASAFISKTNILYRTESSILPFPSLISGFAVGTFYGKCTQTIPTVSLSFPLITPRSIRGNARRFSIAIKRSQRVSSDSVRIFSFNRDGAWFHSLSLFFIFLNKA